VKVRGYQRKPVGNYKKARWAIDAGVIQLYLSDTGEKKGAYKQKKLREQRIKGPSYGSTRGLTACATSLINGRREITIASRNWGGKKGGKKRWSICGEEK